MSLHFNDLFLGVPPFKSVSGRSFCRYVIHGATWKTGAYPGWCVQYGDCLGLRLGPAWRAPHPLIRCWSPSLRISMGEETKATRRRKRVGEEKKRRDGATRPACFRGILRCCWQTLFFLPLPAFAESFTSAFFGPSFFSSRSPHRPRGPLLVPLKRHRYSAIRKNPRTTEFNGPCCGSLQMKIVKCTRKSERPWARSNFRIQQ